MNQELQNAFERARAASKARVIRDTGLRNPRIKAEREKHGVLVEVRHPAIGSVRVKARSPYDAQCAAEEALGMEFLSLSGCEVWSID